MVFINTLDDVIVELKKESSSTLLKFLDPISLIKECPILDVPCGYGRHTLLLAALGCDVIGLDIDSAALDVIQKISAGNLFRGIKLTTIQADLMHDQWSFNNGTLGAVINIHYYQENLIPYFIDSLRPKGYLYLETPDNHGENYRQLPAKNVVSSMIINTCDMIYYKERHAGPPDSDSVSVRLFAQKKS